MRVFFPGGARVDADLGGMIIKTDQTGQAPEPFALFLASIGTCAGIYVLSFCQNRGLPTDDIELIQRAEMDPMTRMLARIDLMIHVPAGFPERYHEALIRSANQCAVKKHLEHPPTIESHVVVG